jgi:hypothetical protein
MKSNYEEKLSVLCLGNINKTTALMDTFAISLTSFGLFIKNIIFIINVVIRIFQVVAVISGARRLICNPSTLIKMAMNLLYYIRTFPGHVQRSWGEFGHDEAYAPSREMAIYSEKFASIS